jgi:hypothetical protein
VRDRHAGCVGAYLVEHDLFDFLLLSLPDNDNHSHRNGPHAQVSSIAGADRQIGRLVEAGGGIDAFLRDYAVIAIADHSHAAVEEAISLWQEFADFTVLQPSDIRPEDAEIALCPSQRAAMIYLLAAKGKSSLLPRIVARARTIPGVDLVMWRDGDDAVIAGAAGELRFAPGDDVADARGARWRVDGELATLAASISDGGFRSDAYPDALARSWDALACPRSGEVLLSAAPGYEFTDWGGADHVGGGSHGSLHFSDSLAPLLCCGIDDDVRGERAQWSIKDVAPMIARHFGVPATP